MSKALKNKVKLNDVVSVKDFGAVGDGVVDDTTAIQAAIASLSVSGGEVFLPQGDYNISTTLTLPYNVSLRGTGMRSTLIRQTILNIPAVNMNNGQSHIKDLGIIFAGTPTSGADAILVSGVDNYINNIRIFNGWNGIKYTGSGNKASGLIINNCLNTGLYFTGCGDVYVSDFLISSGISTHFANGGVRLENRAEAIALCNGSVLGGTYSMVTGASVYDFNLRPAWSKFTQVYFDAAANGSLLNQLFVSRFVNCWFSGGRSGAGSPGMTLDQSNNVTFESCEFFNCGSHGAFLNNNAVGAKFHQCLFADNSVNVAANGARGLLIAANTNDFIVQGCQATNGLYSGGDQGFGIVVTTGTSDRYIVADNLVSGNAIGSVFDGGSGSNKRVANNY